jgi:hypothetical protein
MQGLQPSVHVHDIQNENKEVATLTGKILHFFWSRKRSIWAQIDVHS